MEQRTDLWRLLFVLLAGLEAWLGVFLILYSQTYSLWYNAWTTRIRERHPKFLRPVTPEARASNTKLLTWMTRIFGAGLILAAIFECITMWPWR
jgi:hypothetical protein